ncbi:2OG-Fe dioxygenase family protein [Caulobacter sp. 602-2]|uniref:2OG-Fe dioxygenase family protein n=1 Tax=Caulobacter sp. 602-2 TaxID=2710887 RepID=A0A6G4QVI9_9CAUL|nr:2OG-Fe dioxygenase family protein [Caulobacter sp. 602-2]NGM49467.1 2OG-Fe dioxygenase family protein [Caulobacter sp. 602-2]
MAQRTSAPLTIRTWPEDRPEEPIPTGVDIEKVAALALAADGFARFHVLGTAYPEYLHEALLKLAWTVPASLQPDPYDRSGLRYRRYSSMLYVPELNLLTPMGRDHDDADRPTARYFQPAAYQPEEGDNVRTLPSLTEAQLASQALLAMVALDCRIARRSGVLDDCPAYATGIHFIGLQPRGRQLAAVTPNTIHRDGEPVTFAHLMGKRNVHGGWNAITRPEHVNRHPSELPDSEILARFTLDEPGESYVVDDRTVAHFVEGVGLQNLDEPGHRTVALIDFSPMRRARSNDLDAMSPAERLDLRQ